MRGDNIAFVPDAGDKLVSFTVPRLSSLVQLFSLGAITERNFYLFCQQIFSKIIPWATIVSYILKLLRFSHKVRGSLSFSIIQEILRSQEIPFVVSEHIEDKDLRGKGSCLQEVLFLLPF